MENLQKKIDLTVQWLQDKVEESNTNGLIVGLSGGIDSSVCAALMKKAFPDNALGVILPCSSQSVDAKYAKKLAETIDIDYLTINLTDEHKRLFEKIDKALQPSATAERKTIAKANLKARLRMSTIYGIANSLNYLVIGTDNAAELVTGYFTKYGDGGVDIMPLANLTKGEVYEWADALTIPKEIIERPPTAGLWDGQTDENEMGTTYDYIDAYIQGKKIPAKDQAIIERLNKNSQHKRELPASPPKF